MTPSTRKGPDWGVTVKEEPGGGYKVRWRERGKRPARTFRYKKDADAFAREILRRRQLRGVAQIDAGTITLAAFMEEWWRTHAVPNLAPRTREVYGRMWARHLHPRVGDYALREITPAVVDDLRSELHRAKVGDPTIIKTLTLLQGVMRKAVVRGEIQTNPVREVGKPRQKRTRAASPLAPTTVEAMRSLMGLRDATLLSLLAYAGVRPEEAYNVEVEHLSPGRLLVPARKSPRDRRVHLLAPLAQDLRAWQLASGIRSGPLFPRSHGGAWTDADWANWRKRIYQPAAREVGVTGDMRPYRLRGSFVSFSSGRADRFLTWQSRPGTPWRPLDVLRGCPRRTRRWRPRGR